jgi:ribosomal protein S18 acetylase RimI-like enzyme
MSDEIEIRPATAADLEAAVALLSRQLAEHDIALAGDTLARAVATLLREPALGAVLVASAGDDVLGIALLSFLFTLEHGGKAVWLDELYVDEAQRGRGVGTRLVHAAMDLARERGCVALDLEVEDGHDAAERLYRRLGFHRHRRVRWARRLVPGAGGALP